MRLRIAAWETVTGAPCACPSAAAEGQLPFYRYPLAPADVKAGDVLMSGHGAAIKPGNVLTLRDVPIGKRLR